MSQLSTRASIRAEDFSQLIEIWHSNVDATHDALAGLVRTEIVTQPGTEYLPDVEKSGADCEAHVAGSASVFDDKVKEMFVDEIDGGSDAGVNK